MYPIDARANEWGLVPIRSRYRFSAVNRPCKQTSYLDMSRVADTAACRTGFEARNGSFRERFFDVRNYLGRGQPDGANEPDEHFDGGVSLVPFQQTHVLAGH